LVFDSETQIAKRGCYSFFEITRRDAVQTKFAGQRVNITTVPYESFMAYLQMGRDNGEYRSFVDPRLELRRALPPEVFDAAFVTFSKLSATDGMVRALSEIAKSISEFRIGNYETSLAISWFVSERCLVGRWKSFLKSPQNQSQQPLSNKKSRKAGNDLPIFNVLKELEQTGQLPNAHFQQADRVRRFRNKVVHKDDTFQCDHSHCRDAIELALLLTLDNTGIAMLPDMSLSVVS
jgi:hypothetical protein